MKNIIKLFGILVSTAVIGFTIVSCTGFTNISRGNSSKTEIIVSNNSNDPIDIHAKAQVWDMAGGSIPLQEKNVAIGTSVTFLMDAGSYRVRVIDGSGIFWWYPAGGNTVANMSGRVRLNFTGKRLELR